jgi:hypothetical protein
MVGYGDVCAACYGGMRRPVRPAPLCCVDICVETIAALTGLLRILVRQK